MRSLLIFLIFCSLAVSAQEYTSLSNFDENGPHYYLPSTPRLCYNQAVQMSGETRPVPPHWLEGRRYGIQYCLERVAEQHPKVKKFEQQLNEQMNKAFKVLNYDLPGCILWAKDYKLFGTECLKSMRSAKKYSCARYLGRDNCMIEWLEKRCGGQEFMKQVREAMIFENKEHEKCFDK